jgi:ribonuclease E
MDPNIDQAAEPQAPQEHEAAHENGDQQRKRRRRGRRGGRRRRRGGSEGFREPIAAEGAEPMSGYQGEPEREAERAPEPPWSAEPETRVWNAEPEMRPWPEASEPRHDGGSDAPHREPEPVPPQPEPQRAAEEKPAEPTPAGAVNVPPPVTVTERPANPKRGWWHRLTQS